MYFYLDLVKSTCLRMGHFEISCNTVATLNRLVIYFLKPFIHYKSMLFVLELVN